MGAKKKAVRPGEPVNEEELNRAARAVLEQRRGIKAADLCRAVKAEFKKPRVAPGKEQLDAMLDQLRAAARQGEVFRWQKGSSEFFFAANPNETLEREGRDFLGAGPQTAAALAAHCGLPLQLVGEWIARAAAAGRLFWLPAAPGSKAKRLALEPDRTARDQASRRALATKLKTTKAYVTTLRANGVAEAELAAWVLSELGLDRQHSEAPLRSESETAVQSSESDSQLLLSELQRLTSERRPGSLLLVADLRKRVPLGKQRFDRAALALRDKRTIVLHVHDQAGALATVEREQLVVDARGTHFVGIAVAPKE